MISPKPWESGADVDAAIDRECWRLIGYLVAAAICSAVLIAMCVVFGGR